jgi:hypothetical protein
MLCAAVWCRCFVCAVCVCCVCCGRCSLRDLSRCSLGYISSLPPNAQFYLPLPKSLPSSPATSTYHYLNRFPLSIGP